MGGGVNTNSRGHQSVQCSNRRRQRVESASVNYDLKGELGAEPLDNSKCPLASGCRGSRVIILIGETVDFV